MNCRIKSAIAYSSNNNNGARWPELNIADVVDQNLKNPGREEYDILVLSAPTDDITNLNTSRLANNNTETLELQAIESSKNMFNIAQNSLTHNKNLKKVIIMVHTPRFDDNIKAHLASLANSTLSQLWAISPLKEKINVGRHNLHSWDMDRDTAILGQYEDINTGKYDGIHFYGPCGAKDFTESMNNILRVAGIGNTTEYKINHHNITNSNSANLSVDHTKCEQAQYQWRRAQHRRPSRQTVDFATKNRYYPHNDMEFNPISHGSILLKNRFDIFNQGN